MEVSKADEAEGNEADGRADAGNGKAEVGMAEDGTYGAAEDEILNTAPCAKCRLCSR